MGTVFDNRWGAMVTHWKKVYLEYAAAPEPKTPDDQRKDIDDEAPETPLDEPRPPRVEDPPSEPDQKGPYVVACSLSKQTEAQP